MDTPTSVNADFDQRVVVHADALPWIDSPMAGVSRRMLDRIGGEVARATTIVRYAPKSHFSPHTHGGGEEFIVLEGVFQDEHGDFPAGSYIRNPPTSSHTPGSEPGCVILVKLWQFDPDDRSPVMIPTDKMPALRDADRPGVTVRPLFQDAREYVRIEDIAPGAAAPIAAEGGAELFVLEGPITEGGDTLRRHSWLRVPVGGTILVRAGDEGARLWVKSGHLRHVEAPAAA